MRFKLDENMPLALQRLLADAGHDVETAWSEGLAGSRDSVILEAAGAEGRVLVTFDVGFADARRYPPGSHAGIVVFRLRDQRWQTLRSSVERLLDRTDPERLEGTVAIVDDLRVRYSRRAC